MASDKVPVANIAPFGLRMQPDLKEKVEAAARANNRSLNSEIVARLELTFDERWVGERAKNSLMDAVLQEMREFEFKLSEISDEQLAIELKIREVRRNQDVGS